MKFCSNISFMFGEASTIIERYALAKNAGFKAVESAFPSGFTLEQVKQAKESAGIEQVLINLKADKENPVVTAIPGKEEEFKAAFATTVEYAKGLKARKIHIMAGPVELPDDANWATYESNLKYAAGVLKEEGLIGLIEPINHYSVPGYLLCNYRKAVDIIRRISSPHLKLQLDIFHLQHIQGDITNAINVYMPYVGHVQIAQAPNRDQPGSPGEINYEYVLKLLDHIGYEDWVGLEYKPKGASQDSLEWINQYGYSL